MKCLVFITALALAAPAAAQQVPTDSSLLLALQLATEGQADSARSLVATRLRQLTRSDSLYPEALFVSGMVAANSQNALLAFQRVSIEYSQSAWADQSLLRIAQLQFAGGDLQSAGRTAERILADYPFSDVRAHAAYWAGRVRLDRADLVGACGLLRQALGEAGDDVELANRAAFYVQRCDATAPADTAGRDSTATPGPSQTVYSVQVAAVQSAAAADELMRSLTAAGFESHVVREESLFKVRVGRFTSRDSAQRVQREVRQQFGGSPFIVEER